MESIQSAHNEAITIEGVVGQSRNWMKTLARSELKMEGRHQKI